MMTEELPELFHITSKVNNHVHTKSIILVDIPAIPTVVHVHLQKDL